jgi:lactoylglutathione lyase
MAQTTKPNPHNFSWQQTMLRIKDPKVSVPFYVKQFDMKLVDKYEFPEKKLSLFFLASIPPDVTSLPEPGSEEAHKTLWNWKGTTLNLSHNHGTENDDTFKVNNGNVEPHRGFGHIAFFTDDVYAACEKLEADGVKFQKKPDEGRMKGLAFALDPDGYWIEIIKRDSASPFRGYSLSQTMIRVKDAEKSVKFYCDLFCMTQLAHRDFPSASFSLDFLASLPPNVEVPSSDSEEGFLYMKKMFNPILELTHNHGTEKDEKFSYHNGNTDPKGFGHIGFLVDNVDSACAFLEQSGVEFIKKPNEGTVKGFATVKDPDGYHVQLLPRNFQLS